jgi:hypothetical protein
LLLLSGVELCISSQIWLKSVINRGVLTSAFLSELFYW